VKPPENESYAAVVVRINNVVQLNGLDNLVGAPLLGYQALISKQTDVTQLAVLFTAETQLSEEYARTNNLHRHGNLNDDPTVTGYLEDNRRVKAIKLRGHRSDALLMPLLSLAYTGYNLTQLQAGDTFDKLNGHEICRKYVRRGRNTQGSPRATIDNNTRVDKKYLPEHFDTANYFRSMHLLNDGDKIVITQKLHGTSIRIGHTLVARKLKWKERLAKKLGIKVQTTEYDYVYGSRKVIKDPNNPNQNHYYGMDLWSNEGKKLEGLLPRGYVLYGELVGWTPDHAPIQRGYTYGIPEGERELYVYRVTYVNVDGHQTDLGWEQVKEFCNSIGVKHVPELDYGHWLDESEIAEYWLDKRLADCLSNVLPVDYGTVDEGICLRREGLRPLILKAKSPMFLQHETKMLDKEVEDIEEDA